MGNYLEIKMVLHSFVDVLNTDRQNVDIQIVDTET
jgi:hypothetical protein